MGLRARRLGRLTVTLHGGTLTATGAGVSATRRYRVTQAAADGFSLVLLDPTNVAYQVTGAFMGSDVAFTAHTDPWRGQGRLRRAP